jgi:hypothetical protein
MTWRLLRGILVIGMAAGILFMFFQAGDLSLQARDYVQDHMTDIEHSMRMR